MGHERFVRRAIQFLIAIVAALTATVAAAKELTVVQVASHTHPASAENAKSLALGFNTFFARMNASGGVAGHTVTLRVIDDQFDPKETVRALASAVEDPAVVAVFGVLGTPNVGAVAASKVLESAGIALVGPGTGIPALQAAPNMFPLRASFFDELGRIAAHSANTGRHKPSFIQVDTAFSPALSESLKESLKPSGRTLATEARIQLTPNPKDVAQSVEDAVQSSLASNPDMLVVLAPGRVAADVVSRVRAKRGLAVAIYLISIVGPAELTRSAGIANSVGVMISQAMPFPSDTRLSVMRSYLADLKAFAPSVVPSYTSLEGYLGAKVLHEALKRAGAQPNRQSALAKLQALGRHDLGDVQVTYGATLKSGNKIVDMTMISSSGKLIH